MAINEYASLYDLQVADPDTFVWVKGRLALISPAPAETAVSVLVDAAIWGLSLEAGMAEAVAKGLLALMEVHVSVERLEQYMVLVRRAADTGPTLGRIMATYLAPVLMIHDSFLARFQETIGIMQRKGTYTLMAPLEAMAGLLSQGDEAAASAYLDCLAAIFAQEITYNQSLRLVHLIPKAVSGFKVRRRTAQIQQLQRVGLIDLKLVDPFLEGLDKGVGLLDTDALENFVSQALNGYAKAPESGMNFLSLSSKAGQEVCASLGRAVPLVQIRGQLNRYLNARIGRPVTVQSLSVLSKEKPIVPWVCSDGRSIYLPDEIDCHAAAHENLTLYKALSRLEAGFFECRTFDFDLEKATDQYPEVAQIGEKNPTETAMESYCDGERFVRSFFPIPLATDLFDIFEQARVARHLWRCYPGLMHQVIPLVRNRARESDELNESDLLAPVYATLVLGDQTHVPKQGAMTELQAGLVQMFEDEIDENSPVEAIARLVCLAFGMIQRELGNDINTYRAMTIPFDRRLNWRAIGFCHASQDQTALRIKIRLKEMGVEVYASDLRNRLAEQRGLLAADDIAELVLVRSNGMPSASLTADPSDSNLADSNLADSDLANSGLAELDLANIDMTDLLRQSGADFGGAHPYDGDAVRYPEWALNLQDYLNAHTWVYEKEVPAEADSVFYSDILARHRGIVVNMRRAFELLKPEGLAMLRQWPDGDAFDYRALIDFVMDRRAGRIPSDRLFIKRLKQERDVAVMLLVDLSRSTANAVSGGHTTVLDVAKEALVLFCEALEVVGDDFAVAGFSGTGRHCVDFYCIKRFHESLSEAVRSRISSLKPQRSTRMGAAIRHGTALLAQTEARVRLMIVVSDGFPNDIGYKNDYAISDTCRSIQEARSRNFHVKAITVNIGSDPRLDDLYGRNHHHVIGDVRELPDKLIRLYGALTRY